MRVARGLVLLKPITTEEQLAGSRIVLLQDTRERWTQQQAEVVSVGAWETCWEEDCEQLHVANQHPCSLQIGDWVLVEPRQYVELDDQQWLAPQHAIIAKIVS